MPKKQNRQNLQRWACRPIIVLVRKSNLRRIRANKLRSLFLIYCLHGLRRALYRKKSVLKNTLALTFAKQFSTLDTCTCSRRFFASNFNKMI